jgi:hypothetical protein
MTDNALTVKLCVVSNRTGFYFLISHLQPLLATPKENNALSQLPKHVTKKEIERQARPGESYEQAAERIKGLKTALNKK